MNITVKDLLDAGVHFGHQTKRWNPRSKPYIYDHRQGITIVDLGKTYECLERAVAFLEDTVADGGEVLLIGTKRQAQDIVREAASTVNMPYCVNRWLGGTLTNWETIKRSIAKFKKYQAMEASGELARLPKKEESAIKREMSRMLRNFDGITEMPGLPAAMVVIDVNYEDIAVAEGRRCGIPVVALVDTNSDPALAEYPIPGNDDAVKSIRIIVETLVEAIQSGLSQREARRAARGAADLSKVVPVAAPAPVEVAPAPVPVEPEAVVAPAAEVAAPDEAVAPVDESAPADDEAAASPDVVADLENDIEDPYEDLVPKPEDEGSGKIVTRKKVVRAIKKNGEPEDDDGK